MRAQIAKGGPLDTRAEIDRVRKEAFDKAVGPIADKEVQLPTRVNPKTGKAELALPPKLQRAIADDVRATADPQAVARLENGKVSIRTLDNVRQTLNARHEREPGHLYNVLARQVTGIATTAEPQYGRALDEFGAFSRRLSGFEDGLAGKSPKDLVGAARQDATTADYQAGRNIGTRTRLAEKAGAGEQQAINLAEQLRQPSGATTATGGALSGRETANLQRLGRAETQSAERLAQITPSVEPESARQAQAVQAVAEAAVAAGGHTLSGFKLHAARRILLAVKDRLITGRTATRVAQLLTDPARTAEAIKLLEDNGVSRQRINRLLQDIAGGAGAVTGGVQ